ncbi:MAG: DUF2271 domain-containing protein [Polyangiaceae bacterium]|nr:DUF2271 domain-containing protein [Polyangiaceae bacterium]
MSRRSSRRRRAAAARICRSVAACLSLLGMGCFQPSIPSDYIQSEGADEPPVDLFEPEDAGTPDACGGAAVTAGFRFRVRTSAVGGQFAPRNVGAIWIQNGQGQFVKTLERWGTTRAKWLLSFNEASGGNVVDAITGPTKVAHETHEVRWDVTDAAGCPSPAADYTIQLELTDRSGAGVTLGIPFVLAEPGVDLSPPDAPNFHDMAIDWE